MMCLKDFVLVSAEVNTSKKVECICPNLSILYIALSFYHWLFKEITEKKRKKTTKKKMDKQKTMERNGIHSMDDFVRFL